MGSQSHERKGSPVAKPLYGSELFSTFLNVSGGINNSQTTGLVLTSVSGLDTSGGMLGLTWSDPVDTTVYEIIEYTAISGSELTGVVRGANGTSAKAHLNGATVVAVVSETHINRLADKLRSVDAALVEDPNGNEILKTTYVASAVNEMTFSNAAAGNSPAWTASGQTNVGLDLRMKGVGRFRRPTIVEMSFGSSGVNHSTGDGKAMLRIPEEVNGMNLTGVAGTVDVAGTTSTMDVQLRRRRSAANVDMLSTKLTLDSTEEDSSTAATAAVINTSNDDVVTGDKVYVDVDAVHTTPATGIYTVQLRFELP